MTALAWGAILLGSAFLGAAAVRSIRDDARRRKWKDLGPVSDSWDGFRQQEEARRVDALRHRP